MIRSWLNKNIRGLLIALVMALVFLYFIYMAVQGDRGVFAMMRLQHEQRVAEAALAETRAARATLEARVKHMRPNSIDPDLLEEQSRKQLNLARPNEVVILTAPQENAPPKPVESPVLLQRNK